MAKRLLKDFYTYSVTFNGLAAAATAVESINIQADADFQVQKLTYFADVAAAGQTDSSRIIPLATVLITDTGSGRQLMDQAQPIPNMFGTGQIPFILSQPKIFAARATITFQVTNFDAAQAYTIRLSMIGVKLFKMG